MIEMLSSEKIYRTKFPGDCKKLVEKVWPKLSEIFSVERNEQFNPARDGGACTFHNKEEIGKNLHEWEEFSEFIEFIKPHYVLYLKELGLDYEDINFIAMWANRYPKGSYAWPHKHTENNDLLDILFYIQIPEGSGDLHIEENGNDYRIGIEEGDVVIFPSGLNHWTDPNQSDIDRLLVGIETKIVGRN